MTQATLPPSLGAQHEPSETKADGVHFEYAGIPSIKLQVSDKSFQIAELSAVFLCKNTRGTRFHARPTHQLSLWIESVVVNTCDRSCPVPDLFIYTNDLIRVSHESNDSDIPAPLGMRRSSRGMNFDLYEAIWFGKSLQTLNVGNARLPERIGPLKPSIMQEEWRERYFAFPNFIRDAHAKFAMCTNRQIDKTTRVRCYPAGYTRRDSEKMDGGTRITIIPRLFPLDNLYPSCRRENLEVGEAFSFWYYVQLEDPAEFYLHNDLYNFVAHLNFDLPFLEKSKLNLFVMAPARFKLENFTPTLRYFPSYGAPPAIWQSRNGEPLQCFCAIESASSGYGLSLEGYSSVLINCHFKDEVSPRHVVNWRFQTTVVWGLTGVMLSHFFQRGTLGTIVIYCVLAILLYTFYWYFTGFPRSRIITAGGVVRATISRMWLGFMKRQ